MSWLEVALRGLPKRGDIIRIISSPREALVDCELNVLAATPGEIETTVRDDYPWPVLIWPDLDEWEVIGNVLSPDVLPNAVPGRGNSI